MQKGKTNKDTAVSATIHVHSEKSKNERFPSNFIKTSKYEVWNFIPLNLLSQFSRVSNVYFLVNMCVALVPGVAPITPISAILPLVFVLVVAAIKDGYEDYQRHKDDSRWNSQSGRFEVFENGEERALSGVVRDGILDGEIASKDIEVGDILKVARGEQIRADILLLSSSDQEEDTAYIETMQLDGETNAKLRQAAQTIKENGISVNLTRDLNVPESFKGAHLSVETVQPAANLHDWTGKLEYNGHTEGVSIDQFLYRGSVLVNTSWAYGLVLYTGVNTKMQKNNKKKKPKVAELDRKLNRMILAILLVQQVIIFIMCGLAVSHQSREKGKSWYIDYYLNQDAAVGLFFWRYLTYFILVSVMIPISLFVTIELTKAAQAKFMEWDPNMRTTLVNANGDPIGKGPVGCNPRTSDLNEQLAIVRYIFSDKTGTLTENRMQFHTGDVAQPEHSEARTAGKSFTFYGEDSHPTELLEILRSRQVTKPPGIGQQRAPSNTDNLMWYLMSLAMCHELSILVDDEEAETPSTRRGDKTQYQGASPDEVALAKAAQDNGVEFLARNSSSITISILGKEFVYKIVDTLPFTSKRKMMSIVLQGPCLQTASGLEETKDSVRFCLTKGADSAMMSLCAGAIVLEKDVQGKHVKRKVPGTREDRWYSDCYYERLHGELAKLGGIGLRTLVLAYKPICDEEAFQAWHTEYASAKKLVGAEERDQAMEKMFGQMERDFYICGATAIEDKLQDRVPETIELLIRAGVVIWMLTGDKQETAETIAGTAHLIDKQTWQLCYLTAQLPSSYQEDLNQPAEVRDSRRVQREAWLCGLADPHSASTPDFASRDSGGVEAFKAGQSLGKGTFLYRALEQARAAKAAGRQSAIVTDGATLGVIIPPGPAGIHNPLAIDAVERMWKDFIELSQMVNSGVLCRLTPAQKGQIVKVFQATTGHTALAIGDGSNDVPMINESYVGIGIMGLEGSQAVLASDYAIPRFKHLQRLMTVHGRYSLYRNSMCIMFSFYKNVFLAMLQIYFSFLCGFSGQTLFDSWLLAFQNFAFTSVPPLFVGIFEKDVAEEMAENKPSLYAQLAEGVYFDRKAIAMWFGEGVLHSVLLFALTYSTQRNDDIGVETGRTIDILSHGTVILTALVLTVLAKLCIHIRCWMWIQVIGVVFSIFFYFVFILIYTNIPLLFGDAQFYYSAFYVMNDPKFWLWSLLFVVGVIGSIDLPLLFLQKQYFPTKRDVAQRMASRLSAVEAHKNEMGRS